MTETQRVLVLDGDSMLRQADRMFHDLSECRFSPCTLHSPSTHALVGKPIVWDPYRWLFMRGCSHDLLHPDVDAVAWLRATRTNEVADTLSTHDCCGCFGVPEIGPMLWPN